MSFDMNPADEDPHGECRHEITSLRGEVDRLRQFSQRQAEEIETLNGMADAVEVLRDIGKVFGCGHVDDPDGRRQLTNCIEQEFDRLRAKLAETPPTLEFLKSAAGEPDRIDDENQHDILIWKCGIEWHAGHCFCCRGGNGERLRTRDAVLAAVAKSA